MVTANNNESELSSLSGFHEPLSCFPLLPSISRDSRERAYYLSHFCECSCLIGVYRAFPAGSPSCMIFSFAHRRQIYSAKKKTLGLSLLPVRKASHRQSGTGFSLRRGLQDQLHCNSKTADRQYWQHCRESVTCIRGSSNYRIRNTTTLEPCVRSPILLFNNNGNLHSSCIAFQEKARVFFFSTICTRQTIFQDTTITIKNVQTAALIIAEQRFPKTITSEGNSCRKYTHDG